MRSIRQQLAALQDDLRRLEPFPWSRVETWIAAAKPLVREAFPAHLEDFAGAATTPRWTLLPRVCSGGGRWGGPARDNFAEADAMEDAANRRAASEGRDRILAFVDTLLALPDGASSVVAHAEPIDQVLTILHRFPFVVRALADRRTGRPALTIADEYDVQYVLGGLLAVAFEDVRPEEWAPSHAGSSSRVDFLLKAERIIVETKFARAGHADRQIANELIIDKARYAAHPDCATLVCFVYDPTHAVRNPVALERDLSQADGSVLVRVR